LKDLKKENQPEKKTERIPEHVKLSDFEEYGFYDDDNCYFFNTSKGIIQGSNFVLQPLFHIESVIASKRLFKITNQFKYEKLIELDQKDLISLAGFQLKVESLGNFIWMAGPHELMKLKSFLYAETKSAKIVEQMGWHKDGFFAWCNGIWNGDFVPIDDMGVVMHNDTYYYIPALSKFYSGEDKLFMAEKSFTYKPGNVSMHEYTKLLAEVYGENAKFAFCFLLAAINRDIFRTIFDFFPILNLFGFKGSGKSALGKFLLRFFGPSQELINLPNSTEPAIADYISRSSNALALLDEYKNNFEPSKIEFLKGLWNAIGRNRMNMDKDKKKEMTAVDTGIIIAGQEMPTADIALFSRIIYLTFYKTEYSKQERDKFEHLKNLTTLGLGHLTHEVLSHRKYFAANINKSISSILKDVNELLGDYIIEERIKNNWAVILSAFHCLKDKIDTAYSYIDLCNLAVQQMKVQNNETKSSNELATFWKIIEYLDAEGLIHADVDYKIKICDELKVDGNTIQFAQEKQILIIHHSRTIPLYRKTGKSMGENVLPRDSIDYYLRRDNRFYGKKLSERFVVADPKTGFPKTDSQNNKQYKITTAYCFDYEKLGISLTDKELITTEEDEFTNTATNEKPF